MDAFFASIEILDFPGLADRSVIVGGSSDRGVVAAASYKAREYGIHSAMPIFQAKRLCPDLVIQPGRMNRYVEISRKIIRLLGRYSPLVEQVSIDEAFIDLSGTMRLFGRYEDIVVAIRREIKEETGLTCSAGLSTGKLVAKIASDIDKPDGMAVIPPGMVDGFLCGLPIGKVPGVGEKSAEQLRKKGIRYLGDIRKLPPARVSELFGKQGSRLLEIALGDHNPPVIPYSRPKSISNELTFAEDTADKAILERYLLSLSEKVAGRLRNQNLAGRTITLKLKDFDHSMITRSITLDNPTHQGRKIYAEAGKLLAASIGNRRKRLIGVGVSNLEPEEKAGQYDLFDERPAEEERWDRVDQAVDDIAHRFGHGAIRRGRLRKES